MANDLNDIYDGEVDEFNFKPVTPSAPEKNGGSFQFKPINNPTHIGGVAHTSPVNVGKFSGYIDHGVYDHQNINKLRGEGQSAWDKIANVVPRTAGKTLTQIVEGFGYIPEIFTNNDGDYSNDLTKAAQSANKWLDEAMPIYRTSTEEDSWSSNFGDLGFWLENAEGLVSSIGAFAVQGTAISKLFGALGSVGRATRIGQKIVGVGNKLAGGINAGKSVAQFGERILTAGMLAYTEGAMSGKRVFDEVYTVQLNKLLTAGASYDEAHNEAKRVAAKSAAATVQLNTVLNTGMNMVGGMSMFYNHGRNKVIDTAKRVLTQRAGEADVAFMKRLATETGEKYAKDIVERMSMGKAFTIGREAVAEGVEELTNQFSERTGIEEGSKGNTMDFFEQFGQLSKYFDRTMDKEGALNFALGAIGGPAQGAVTQNIPIHKIKTGTATTEDGAMANAAGDAATSEKDAASTYLGKKFNYVSKRNLEKFHQTQYFDDIKNKYAADAKFIVDTNEGIEAALKKGDALEAEKLRNDMFNVMNLQTVRMGHTDAMKETYKSIASVDNTKDDTTELTEKVEEQTTLVEEIQAKGEDSTQAEADLKVLENALENSKGETAAMKLGLTDSTENNDYKEKAAEAMRDLDTLQKMHDKTMAKYGTDGDSYSIAQGHVSDFIFNRQAQTFLLKKDKARYEQELSELETDENDFTESDLEAAMETGTAFNEGIDRYHSAKNMIANIRAMLGKAKANPTPENLAAARKVLDKIGSLDTAVVDDADSMVKAIGTAEKALDHQDRILERELGEQQQTMAENSPEFQAWQTKNPEGKLRDYINENYGEKSKRSTKEAYQKHIAETDALIKMHEGYLAKLKDSRTLTTITKNAEKFYETLSEKAATEAAELNRQYQLDAKIDQERKAIEQQALRAARMETVLEAQTIRAQVVEQQRTIERLQGKLLSPLLLTNAQTLEVAAQLDVAKQVLAHLKHNLIVLTQQIDEYTNRINGTFEELSEEAKAMAEVEEARMKEEAEREAAEANAEPQGEPEQISQPIELSIEDTSQPPQLPATAEFFKHLDTLSGPKRRYAEQTLTDLLAKQLEFSLDLLGKGGELTMQLMKDHIAGLESEVLEAQEVIEEAEEVVTVSKAVEQQIPVSEITAPPPIPNTSTLPIDEYTEPVVPVEKPQHSDEYIPQTGIAHDGSPPIIPVPLPDNDRNWDVQKLKHGHDKLATRTAEYTQSKDEAGRSMQSAGLLNDGVGDGFNYDVIDPTRNRAGTEVWFEVATDFDGLYNDYEADTGDGEQKQIFKKFIDFATGNEVNGVPEIKEEAIANVPIRVMSEDAQGRPQMIAYYPTADRMTATNSDLGGDERFRNIQNILRDKEGNIIETDNAQKEYDKTLALRKQLIQAYYDGVKIESTITGVSQGVPFHTKQAGSAADRIKGKSRIGIVRDGVVVGVNDITLPPMDAGMAEALENKSVAMLLMPNGEYYPALLQSEKLYTLGETKTAKQQETFNTVKRVIELHALAQLGEEKSPEVKKEFEDIEAVTGFDITTYAGFRSFISQYYTHFSAVDKFVERGADGIILHNYEKPSAIGDTGIYISSISGISTSKIAAKLNEDGTLSEEFSAKLEELLANRYKMIVTQNSNLALTNVNETKKDKFKSLVYMFKEESKTESGEVIKAGMRWVEAKTFDSYNDYLLSQMQTKVSYYKSQDSEDGSIQLDRSDEAPGKTVKHWNYGANPVRSFNIGPIQAYKKRASTQDTTLTPKAKDESAVVPGEVMDLLTDIYGDDVLGEHKSKTATRFEIPRAKLEEMYNFTRSNGSWNGKSVEQVINELTKAQMTDLKSGWNPFSSC
jgi:hypothetical protein